MGDFVGGGMVINFVYGVVSGKLKSFCGLIWVLKLVFVFYLMVDVGIVELVIILSVGNVVKMYIGGIFK